jgi:hypothetical protein
VKLVAPISIVINVILIACLVYIFMKNNTDVAFLQSELDRSKNEQVLRKEEADKYKKEKEDLDAEYKIKVKNMTTIITIRDQAIADLVKERGSRIDNRKKEIIAMPIDSVIDSLAAPGTSQDITDRTNRLGDDLSKSFK